MIRTRLARLRQSGLIRQVAEQALANVAVQALGAISTLSFVHLLPTNEYAVFGLCVTTVGFIAITSDLGLMASMNYFWRIGVGGGPAFTDRYAAIKRVRMTLYALSGVIAACVLGWLEYRQGVATLSIVLTVALTLAVAWTQISTAMILLALRLSQQLRRAYRIDLAGGISRAVLAAFAFILAIQQAWLPLITLGISALLMLALARRSVPEAFRTPNPPSRHALRSVIRYVIPTMPSTIVFATQDMFVFWLASLSGGALVVAQTFALGRLAAIFVTLNSIMANVILPRIVNLADDRHAHRNGVLSIGAIGFFCAMLTGFSAIFPGPVLWVLGANYKGLEVELVLSLGAASFMLIAQALGQLNRTMGWVRWEAAMIGFHVLVVIALVPFFNFGTAKGVLSFHLIVAAVNLCEMAAISVLGALGLSPPVDTVVREEVEPNA